MSEPKQPRRYTPSEASRMAARMNGAKSRGPRSTAARKAMSMHALKDGCYSQTTVLDTESQPEFDALAAEYVREAKAASKIEVELATAAATAHWKWKRVVRADANVLRKQVHNAECGLHEQGKRDVAALAERLPFDSASVVSQLKQTTEGCLYLIEQWEFVWQTLEVSKAIWRSQQHRCISLMGRQVTELFTSDDVQLWCFSYIASYPREGPTPIDLALALKLFGEYRPKQVTEEEFADQLGHWLEVLPPREKALAWLRSRIDQALNELYELADRLTIEEAVGYQMDVGAAHADDSVKGARRLRQEQVHQRALKEMLAAARAMVASREAGNFEGPVTIETPPHVAATAGRPGAVPEGANSGVAGEPESDAQNQPKWEPASESKCEVAEEVAAGLVGVGNPNGETPDERPAGQDGGPPPACPEMPPHPACGHLLPGGAKE
ncbi:MAG: hypothetical protein ACRD3W_21460, partial [Terriglobales bacterium]